MINVVDKLAQQKRKKDKLKLENTSMEGIFISHGIPPSK